MLLICAGVRVLLVLSARDFWPGRRRTPGSRQLGSYRYSRVASSSAQIYKHKQCCGSGLDPHPGGQK
jgi:hypothetical protein